jgi:hypothetical protein
MADERSSIDKKAVAERRSAAVSRAPSGREGAGPMPLARSVQQRLGNRGAHALARQVVASSGSPGAAAAGGAATGQLSLSHPGEAREREAESVADHVMRMTESAATRSVNSYVPTQVSAPIVYRLCAACETVHAPAIERDAQATGGELQVQRQEATSATAQIKPSVSADIRALQGKGSPLPPATRAFFEPRFGASFDQVRIHTDTHAVRTASLLNAKAFTVGRDIAFAAGQFAPDSQSGRRLLAHELTHVVQNRADGRTDAIDRQPANPAAGRQGGDIAKAPPGGSLYYYRGVVMTTDEKLMIDELRRLVAREGLTGARGWYATMVRERGIAPQLIGTGISAHGFGGRTRVRWPLDARRDMMQADLAAQCFPVVVRLYAKVLEEALKFLNEFDLRSKVVVEAMLELSETKIHAEQTRYGLKTTGMPIKLANPQMTKIYGPTDYIGAEYTMSEGPGKSALTASAKKLAATLRKLSKKWGDQISFLGTTGDGEFMIAGLHVKDEAGHARWQKDFDDLEFNYLLDRAQAVAEFPILASFATMTTKGTSYLDRSAAELEGISTDSGAKLAKTLNREVNEKLASIYKTRWSIDQGELSVWALESIVDGTRSTLNVQPGSMQDKLVGDKVELERRKDTNRALALGVIAIALGLLAAIPSGGSSLAAGIAVAAGVGSAALSVTIAYSELKQYAVQTAASGTDFAKAHAISQDDPSMFWLALSIVGAVVDFGAAVKAFKAFTPAARRLREAKRLAALGHTLSAEEQAAMKTAREALLKQSEQYPGLAKKIEAQLAHVAGEEAKNTERLATRWQDGLNAESRALMDASPGVKAMYRDMDPLVRDILTHCASICIIPNLTNRQYAQIKAIVYEHGAEELGGLKQYFHFRRNDLDAAIKELREAGTQGLGRVKSLLQYTLTSAPIQAEEDALAMWSHLQKSGTNIDSKAGFIEKYRAGLRFDEGALSWYSPVRGLNDTVPLGASAADALQTFKNSEGFSSFQKLLQDEKLIAGEGDLIAAIEAMKPSPRGRPVDAVRHSIKDLYRDALVARMAKPNEAVMRLRYPGLPWSNAEEAMRQASYQEMRRMTDGLAASDKGNLFERWYKVTLSPSASQHVEVEAAKLKMLGSTYDKGRVIDLLEGDAIHELKRVAGSLGEHDLGQFADNMLVVGKKVELGGKPVRRAIYTFPIPQGVQANAKWMSRQLGNFPHMLTFEVFNAFGERRIISAAADLERPELWTWLGLTKPK